MRSGPETVYRCLAWPRRGGRGEREGAFLTRIGIVDDHPVFRVGLNRTLEREPDMEVLWELGSVTDLQPTLETNPEKATPNAVANRNGCGLKSGQLPLDLRATTCSSGSYSTASRFRDCTFALRWRAESLAEKSRFRLGVKARNLPEFRHALDMQAIPMFNICYADKEGNVRIAGRKKEIINRGGKKYFPREIEELLYQHPTIVQAAIVGAPDSRLGEKNCLCAIIKPGSSLTLDEVVSFLKGRVADYKLPEALVVMSDFPMTPTGKIRRPELVKRVAGTV